MHLIVLAAGFATRLYPLTRTTPKPLLEVGGLTLLDRLLQRFAGQVSGTTLVTNHKFHAHFVAWRARTGLTVGLLDDGVSDDRANLGALRDLQLALAALPPVALADGFVVAGGDNIFDFPVEPIFARFARDRRPLLPLRRVEGPLVPNTYGEVEVDRAGVVTSFREKPADPRSPLAAFCLYFLPADAKQRLAEYLATGGNGDAPGHFFAWLVRQTRVDGLEIRGRWFDIGNQQTLAAARAAYGG